MVQNIIENQIYMALAKTKKDNKIITNKFHEANDSDKNNENMDIEEDNLEDDFGFNSDYTDTILSERLVINAISLPGLTNWHLEKYSSSSYKEISKKKVLVYDYDNNNSDIKVNDERMTIGLAYIYNDFIILHSWFNINNYISDYLPKKINLPNENLCEIRKEMLEYFNSIFLDDEILSEYLILLMTSQIIAKVGTLLLGKLSLNLQINSHKENNSDIKIKNILKEILKNISTNFLDLKITTNSLNESSLVPRFNVETEELNQGELQIMKKTLLILDEVDMDDGKLDNNGVIKPEA